MGGLANLRYLDLSSNNLMLLPVTLENLRNLEALDLRGQPLQEHGATLGWRDLIDC